MNKVVVLYFSITGTTAQIAKQIASQEYYSIFRLEPKIAYSRADLNWHHDSCRANLEQRNQCELPEIQSVAVDFSQYDTLVIGYPIWWGIAPKIIERFFQEIQIQDKTIVPFCTSGGSGFGKSSQILKTLAPQNHWCKGIDMTRASDEQKVQWQSQIR